MTAADTAPFRALGDSADLDDGYLDVRYLEDLKRRVCVVRVGGTIYAFDDLCRCGGAPCPLSSGLLTGSALLCQCHNSLFDIATGAVLRGPATSPLVTHPARERDGRIEVRL